MWLLVKSIQRQIQQLKQPELKQIVLKHLNLNADCLVDLFTKQEQVMGLATCSNYAMLDNPLLALIHTYGPQSFVNECSVLFSSLPQLDWADFKDALLAECYQWLPRYRAALPLIKQIQQQPKCLIEIMAQATGDQLEAFKHFSPDNNWTLLIEPFIKKQEFDTKPLINFLRQPQWEQQVQEIVSSLTRQANDWMSLRFLLQVGTPGTLPADRQQQLLVWCKDYPFIVHGTLLQLFITRSMFLSTMGRDHIIFFEDLLSRLKTEEQRTLIMTLEDTHLMSLIKHGIDTLINGDKADAPLYQRMLFVLCRQIGTLELKRQHSIRSQLNPSAEYSFVQAQSNGNIYPIVQALSSPQFMATLTPPEIRKWLLHYHCLVLTLSADELVHFIDREVYSEDVLLVDIKNQVTTQHGEKQQRVIEWCIERSSHILLTRLIKHCQQHPKEEDAHQALNQIYNYYALYHAPLRFDLAIAAARYFYGLQDAPDLISGFFYQEESQCQVFVDESSRVWRVDKEGPTLLTSSNKTISVKKEGKLVGTVSDTGYFKSVSTQHLQSGAQLLAHLNRIALEQSEQGLGLLMTQVLLHGSGVIPDKNLAARGSKRQWFERQVARAINETNISITVSTMAELIRYLPASELCSLGAYIPHPSNAKSWFLSVLNNDKARDLFLAEPFASNWYAFLQQHEAGQCLAAYLLHYHQELWFLDGLARFIPYSHSDDPFILANALELLYSRVEQGELSNELFNTVLSSLIATETAATLVLQGFWRDKHNTSIQDIRTSAVDAVGTHFNKTQLVLLLKQLSKEAHWQISPFYRMVLFLLQSQSSLLLHVSKNKESQWRSEELSLLIGFVKRHLAEKIGFDKESILGSHLLSELVFYCASLGQMSLFFKEESQCFSRIITTEWSSDLVITLAQKWLTPLPLAEAGLSSSADSESEEDQPVLNNPLSPEWWDLVKRANERWNKKIPLLSPYLLHYSGQVQTLSHLLTCYFRTCAQRKTLIHPISDFLTLFPKSPVSAVLFALLEEMVIKKPQYLDRVILGQMAHYYINKKEFPFENETRSILRLLTCWGNAKHYALVGYAGTLMLSEQLGLAFQARLRRAIVEAKVEQELKSRIGTNSWWNGFIMWLKRAWHYGRTQPRSNLVAFANETVNDLSIPKYSFKEITPSSILKEGPKPTPYQLQLDLLTQVVRSSITRKLVAIGVSPHVFHRAKPNSEERTESLASQAVSANV